MTEPHTTSTIRDAPVADSPFYRLTDASEAVLW
jgi:hypothetical protein